MQINSASSYTPQSSGSLSVDNPNQVAEQRDRFRVQETQQSTQQVEKSNKQSAQQTQEQSKQAAQVERFDIDEQALALVEQAQFENQQAQLNQSSSRTSLQSNNAFSGQSNPQSADKNGSQASYDSPSKQNQTAIAAYSSIDNIAQRESIKQVFGVDLLA
ncbi:MULTISPECIES: hypothetical protein [unclassified Colwellia]|uniref:hypothetical protein n=1 Tax=unclassified Colwellia TaxID=196834 RepID=UPI0015F3910C|nr:MULTISPECIES: hypothetical protein [unclassified Colwellia]MBA6233020.1 hypothetical protein [Colwellia sp. MB02u-7]MBA6236698.1 hypothetical protein [Colwellia sp. MB02u-11]MBA6255890.1 hypothetical protein [Colwellia sp. MB3u-28]MBA6262032.1 hypothetical protein [Colwellia sp. MB3u-41]MBA6299000.1 hypothetical protein [Colwellia sp. MB3u-22]